MIIRTEHLQCPAGVLIMTITMTVTIVMLTFMRRLLRLTAPSGDGEGEGDRNVREKGKDDEDKREGTPVHQTRISSTQTLRVGRAYPHDDMQSPPRQAWLCLILWTCLLGASATLSAYSCAIIVGITLSSPYASRQALF